MIVIYPIPSMVIPIHIILSKLLTFFIKKITNLEKK